MEISAKKSGLGGTERSRSYGRVSTDGDFVDHSEIKDTLESLRERETKC